MTECVPGNITAPKASLPVIVLNEKSYIGSVGLAEPQVGVTALHG